MKQTGDVEKEIEKDTRDKRLEKEIEEDVTVPSGTVCQTDDVRRVADELRFAKLEGDYYAYFV